MLAKRPTYGIIVILVICAAAAYLFLTWPAAKTAQDNSLALASLNSKILLYGSNVRYLLMNSSAFYSALGSDAVSNASYTSLYNGLVGISGPYGNISDALSVSAIANQQGYTGIQDTALSDMLAQGSDWYAYSNYARAIELEELLNIGYFGRAGSNLFSSYVLLESNNNKPDGDAAINRTVERQLGIPENTTPLQSVYELKLSGLGVLSGAEALASLYKTGIFKGELVAITTTPQPGVGLDTGQYTGLAPLLSETGPLNGNYFDLSSPAQMSTGVLSLMGDAAGPYGLPRENASSLNRMFYKLALVQYLGYELSQIFYNVSITPNIDLSYYANNTLLLNLGNLNLASPSITLYVDNNKTQFTRYYNDLISYNTHLGLGNHNISVNVGNTTLSGAVYVSPALPLTSALTSKGNMLLSFHDYGYPALNISNVSVKCALHPIPVIVPWDKASILYNQSLQSMPGCQGIRIINATYYQFTRYIARHDNYTGLNYTTANYSSHSLAQLNNFSLVGYDYVTLDFSVPNAPIGTLVYYTVAFDTNYGPGRGMILAKAD